jgi:hypothetical protein
VQLCTGAPLAASCCLHQVEQTAATCCFWAPAVLLLRLCSWALGERRFGDLRLAANGTCQPHQPGSTIPPLHDSTAGGNAACSFSMIASLAGPPLR